VRIIKKSGVFNFNRKLTMATRRKAGKLFEKQTPKRLLANHEIVVLAAYLAGAQSASADTEDIAVTLAPISL